MKVNSMGASIDSMLASILHYIQETDKKGGEFLKKHYLVSHGKLASGILDSIKLIAGKVENIEALELHPGDHPKDLAAKIEADVQANRNTQFIIFTDLKGGSIHNAMMPLCIYDNVSIISGFNLGMVLDVVLLFEECSISDLAQSAVAVGKDNIEVFNKNTIEKLLHRESDIKGK